jgi:hypothetical protein
LRKINKTKSWLEHVVKIHVASQYFSEDNIIKLVTVVSYAFS